MYKNRAENGLNNICGKKIKEIKEGFPKKTSQKSYQICCRLKVWTYIRMLYRELRAAKGL